MDCPSNKVFQRWEQLWLGISNLCTGLRFFSHFSNRQKVAGIFTGDKCILALKLTWSPSNVIQSKLYCFEIFVAVSKLRQINVFPKIYRIALSSLFSYSSLLTIGMASYETKTILVIVTSFGHFTQSLFTNTDESSHWTVGIVCPWQSFDCKAWMSLHRPIFDYWFPSIFGCQFYRIPRYGKIIYNKFGHY